MCSCLAHIVHIVVFVRQCDFIASKIDRKEQNFQSYLLSFQIIPVDRKLTPWTRDWLPFLPVLVFPVLHLFRSRRPLAPCETTFVIVDCFAAATKDSLP
jgi:hypothetical protein